ncbi:MAG TPA: M48 family metallopeptidase [Gaiellaceae bacterium]|nr:M48 family metallopeptidase [Gaiellaceae bacterium]
MSSLDFSHEEVLRAGAYHRPLYLALAADTALSLAVLAVLGWVWSGPYHLVSGLGWAGAAAGYAAIVTTVSALVRLPLGFWHGWIRERRWGFSTQTAGAWLADRAKGWGVSVALTAAAWTAVVGLARAFPSGWPLVAGAVLAVTVLVLSFLGPLVFEPLFNRFRPLEDERLAGELRELARRAGVPVRDVLVADASRRTTKVNAYVSGLGRTRRVVLYDTLLAEADEREIELILAHELGHRRERHVLKGTLLGMAGAVVAVVAVWAVLGSKVASPDELPAALLVLAVLELLGLAPGNGLSRRWERVADRFSLDLTRDLEAFERTQRELARKNLSDLEPPRVVYVLLFSHPTPPERLALGRAWAASVASS